MHHLIYMSRATGEPTHYELVALLKQARATNQQLGVTGALVYGDHQFIQVMEGEEAVISALYARIAQDPRHQDVFKVADKAVGERTFLEWSMAFQVVSDEQFEELAGYVSPDWLEEMLFATNPADSLILERMRELVLTSSESR